jgi:hypothetical protein
MDKTINKKGINLLVYGAFIIIILFSTFFFIFRYRHFRNLERGLIPIHIVGSVDSMRNLNRGNYFIKVRTKDSIIRLKSLPLTYDIERTGLKVGDSVSKDQLSRKIVFFRSDSGKRIPLFEYQITD